VEREIDLISLNPDSLLAIIWEVLAHEVGLGQGKNTADPSLS